MNIEEIREYCLSLKGTNESFPFNETTLVFKALTKMYCLLSLDEKQINIKVKPEEVIRLQEEHKGIIPAYHMNKKHWISVVLNDCTNTSFIKNLIQESYQLVILGMTKKDKQKLKNL